MTDQLTDRPLTERLTIDEAAATLGLTPEGVRSRLRRGTLAGERTGRTWAVFVTGQAVTSAVSAPVSTDHAADRKTDRPDDRSPGVPPRARRRPTAQGDVLAELRADVAFLRAELERRGGEIARQEAALEREQVANAELRRLLAVHMPGLPAPAESAATRADSHDSAPIVPAAPQTPSRPWWRVWRRG